MYDQVLYRPVTAVAYLFSQGKLPFELRGSLPVHHHLLPTRTVFLFAVLHPAHVEALRVRWKRSWASPRSASRLSQTVFAFCITAAKFRMTPTVRRWDTECVVLSRNKRRKLRTLTEVH
ncbi:unnamed protein product [Chondrus crispus]|uniref:Uncharacterized protein n=1 Tax=Chondrus crispus TaxID=2769 RepID=R7QR57_CHOCR|nr:unnamed protein product [Chondrus crispus]CDF39956.1 unnamed protein product [Chondrus crispus]|eukprot:XP_005710250.1 unnamed protein product [Chondrus crispus]